MFSPPTKHNISLPRFNDVYGSSKYKYMLKTKQTPQINFTNDMSYNVKGRDDQNYQMTYTRFEPETSKPKSETTELSKDC